MADLSAPRGPFQIFAPGRRRSRAPAMASEAPLSGPAPSPGLVTPTSGGWARRFERRGIELAALFGWVGNGR
jgi:hypothetical protein